MTPEQALAIVGGLTALMVAVTALLVQVRGLRHDVDGRMAQLVKATSEASRKQGELEGRDFMLRLQRGGPASASDDSGPQSPG